MNIKKSNDNVSCLLFVFLLIRYTIAYNAYFRTNRKVWLLISGIVGVCLLYKILSQNTVVRMSYYAWWTIAMYAFFALSTIWSINRVFSSNLKTLAMIYIMGVLLSFVVNSMQDLKRLMFANYLAQILCGIYVFTSVDRSVLGEQRIGADMEGLWNSNNISQVMCFGAFLSLYYFETAKRKIYKIISLVTFIFFGYLILYCGSRSGLFLFFIGVISYLCIRSKRSGRVRGILIGLVLIMATYYLVINYEPLYNVIGIRMDNMMNGLLGSGTGEESFNTRYSMIINGLQWFLERPLFGYGIENFGYLYYRKFGVFVYAHNNFIELLVSGGIIGVVLYYSIYIYIFIKLWTPAVRERDRLAACMLAMTFSQFMIQFVSVVNYYKTYSNMVLLLANIYIIIRKRKDMFQ